MHSSIFILASVVSVALASYSLEDDYSADVFGSMFDFYTGSDPTHGYVNYVDQTTAQNEGLFSTSGSTVYIGVDHNNTASSSGRDSVRISSQKTYNHGLFVLDLAHMPGGQCGTWPAFWLLGPNWPNEGEIDIIEGVNSGTTNAMTLHTNSGCSITSTGNFAGTMSTSNCDVDAAGQDNNAGCSIGTANSETYGAGFNEPGGGVYATEWTSEAISIWFFSRNSIPSDITSGSPNPDGWGLPLAQFTGGCDIDEHIQDQQIVFDITFCGDWAGQVWSTDSTCGPMADTCQDYVQNNPSAFADTYWSVNSLQVFLDDGSSSTSSSSTSAASVASTVSDSPNTEQTSTTTIFSTTTVYTTIELESAGVTTETLAPSVSAYTTMVYSEVTYSTSDAPEFYAATSTSSLAVVSTTAAASTDSPVITSAAVASTSIFVAAATSVTTDAAAAVATEVTTSMTITMAASPSASADPAVDDQAQATTAAAAVTSSWGGNNWNWNSAAGGNNGDSWSWGGNSNSGNSWGNGNSGGHGWKRQIRAYN